MPYNDCVEREIKKFYKNLNNEIYYLLYLSFNFNNIIKKPSSN